MPKVQPYTKFLQLAGESPRDSFLARWTAPFLYFEDLPELEQEGRFTTIRLVPGQVQANYSDGVRGLVAIQKDSRSNAFGMMITMGRAANNDLVVPDQRISKFHGYFRQVGERWLLTDANSTNGICVDGVRVAPERSVELSSGAKLLLAGAVAAEFLAPADLYARIQADRLPT